MRFSVFSAPPFNNRPVSHILLAAVAFVCLAIPAGAQGRAAGGGMGGPGGKGGFGGGMGVGGATRAPMSDNSRPNQRNTEVQGGLQLAPPGRWWDDKDVARSIGLDSRQQKRLDDVFGGNRDNLLKLYKNLQHEESQLQKLTRSRVLDENQIFQQIDRVTQARGELEKANAHMLLQLRKELTPDQTSKLDDLRPQAAPAQ